MENKNKRTKTPKTPSNKVKKENTYTRKHVNTKVTYTVLICAAILLLTSTYAWFSTNLDVRINTFKFTVTRDTDLEISFDGVNYDYSLDISKDFLLNELEHTYPNHISQWAANGMVPVSTIGITDPNSPLFDIYETSGILYKKKKAENGFFFTNKSSEKNVREFNSYVAFDIFIRNKNNSPKPDNFYFNDTTKIVADTNTSDQMIGLINSLRLGVLKIGSVPLGSSVEQVQNITCNGQCESIIYEPNSKNHSELSIERAKKYNVDLVDGIPFPTYGLVNAGGPFYLSNSVSGAPDLNPNYFVYQKTMTEQDFDEPIFQLPNGITKARIYLWIEGQDIDSLETHSDGTELDINIDFVKDTAGYDDEFGGK